MASTRGNRIEAIDGLRAIAVLAVVLYHYYYRFSPPFSEVNYLPYQYEAGPLIKHGFYGVQLFFIISGFVIHNTLNHCATFKIFVIKRVIRLWPSLLLCSVITFFFVPWLDPSKIISVAHSNSVLDFLPSLTFTPPEFWNYILKHNDIQYVDGVYWSLFTEITFYLIGSWVFFLHRSAFLTNWTRLTATMIFLRIVASPKLHFLFSESINSFFDFVYRWHFQLGLNYWPYFALGIFFNQLYLDRSKITRIDFITMGLLVSSELYFLSDHVLQMLFLLIIAVFLSLTFKNRWLAPLSNRLLVRIGIISYPIYLLHENLGLVLINRLASFELINVYAPLVTMVIVFIVSYAIYELFERPVIHWAQMIVFAKSYYRKPQFKQ